MTNDDEFRRKFNLKLIQLYFFGQNWWEYQVEFFFYRNIYYIIFLLFLEISSLDIFKKFYKTTIMDQLPVRTRRCFDTRTTSF